MEPSTVTYSSPATAKIARVAAPRQWLSLLLEAFIDILEPSVDRFSRRRRWVVQETENGDLAFYRMKGASSALLGYGSALTDKSRQILRGETSSDVELRLLPGRLTQTTIRIPAGALDYIEQIVDSRLDRLTPWKPEKVLYGVSKPGKPASDGQFELDFVATSRDIADVSIGKLRAFGLTPSTMGSGGQPITQPLNADLLNGSNDKARKRRRSRIRMTVLAWLIISASAYLASLVCVFQSSRNLAEIDQQMAAARRMLTQSFGAAGKQQDLDLIASKTRDNARFVLVDKLSEVIPDNTFLDELEIQQDSMRMAGSSTEASALIEILEAQKGISDARFSAPVTRQDDGRDRFDITATLKTRQGAPTP